MDPPARLMSANAASGARSVRAGHAPWRPLIALAVLTLIWGLSVPVMKLGLTDLSPLTLVSLRYVCAAPFFALLLIRRRLPPPRAMAALAGLAALGLATGQVLQILGVQRTSAAVATIITATIPIFTVVLAAIRLRQSIRPHQAAGLVVALGGIALATIGAGNGAAEPPDGAIVGDLLLLLSSICIAAYYVLGAEMGEASASSWYRRGARSLAACSWHRSQFGAWPEQVSSGRRGGVGALAYLSLLVTVLGIWIWLNALRALPVRIAASSQYVQPLIGICASAAIFGASLGARFGIGSALVLAGIALSSFSRSYPR